MQCLERSEEDIRFSVTGATNNRVAAKRVLGTDPGSFAKALNHEVISPAPWKSPISVCKMVQWGKGLAAKPNDPSLTSGSHMVEEIQLPPVVLWSPHIHCDILVTIRIYIYPYNSSYNLKVSYIKHTHTYLICRSPLIRSPEESTSTLCRNQGLGLTSHGSLCCFMTPHIHIHPFHMVPSKQWRLPLHHPQSPPTPNTKFYHIQQRFCE